MSLQDQTDDLVTVRVHQMAIRSVLAERTVVVQMPTAFSKDQSRVDEFIRAGECNLEPFPCDPMNGTEDLQVMGTAVGAETDEAPDVRAAPQDGLNIK
jgi:hypothetical protein